jgi:phosphate transport system substrate-binding protein
MAYTAMQNAAGNWVQPSAASFAAAAASADWKTSRDFSLVITNAPGADAWPIAATNFILVYKQPALAKSGDAKRTRDTLDFFKWAFEQGQPQADALHFVPLPAELVQQIEAYWASDIKA